MEFITFIRVSLSYSPVFPPSRALEGNNKVKESNKNTIVIPGIRGMVNKIRMKLLMKRL